MKLGFKFSGHLQIKGPEANQRIDEYRSTIKWQPKLLVVRLHDECSFQVTHNNKKKKEFNFRSKNTYYQKHPLSVLRH